MSTHAPNLVPLRNGLDGDEIGHHAGNAAGHGDAVPTAASPQVLHQVASNVGAQGLASTHSQGPIDKARQSPIRTRAPTSSTNTLGGQRM